MHYPKELVEQMENEHVVTSQVHSVESRYALIQSDSLSDLKAAQTESA